MLRAPYERTIREYLGLGKGALLKATTSIPDQVHGLQELQRGQVLGVQLDDPFEVPERRRTSPKGIEFRKYIKTHVGVAVNLASHKPVGFICGNYPISILNNLGVGSHLTAIFDPEYSPYPRSYSPTGFRNRLATHALLVTWALLDKEDVPREVRDEYCCVNGRLVSREKLLDSGRVSEPKRPAEHILHVYAGLNGSFGNSP